MEYHYEKRMRNFGRITDYVLWDEEGNPVIEAVWLENPAMIYENRAYELVNHVDGTKKMIYLSHEIRVRDGVQAPEFIFSECSQNAIEINGKSHWEILMDYGVVAASRLQGARLECEFFSHGKKIGQTVNATAFFHRVPVRDQYYVEGYPEYLEPIFLACLTLTFLTWVDFMEA